MGANKSKSQIINDIVNESMTEVILNVMNRTSLVAETTQDIKLRGFSLFNIFRQDVSYNVDAVSKVQITNEMINEMVNKIVANATSETSGLQLMSGSEASVRTKIRNTIQTNLKSDIMQEISSRIRTSQSIDARGVVIGNVVTQDAKVIQKIVQDALAQTQVVNMISNDIDASATAKVTSPLDFLNIWIIVIVIVIVAIVAAGGFVGYKLFIDKNPMLNAFS